MSDPMEPINNLAKAAAEALKDVGLDIQAFMIMPNPSGGPAAAQIVVTVSEDAGTAMAGEKKPEDMTPEELAAYEEQKAMDEQFAEMMRAQEKDEAEQAAADAAQAALDLQRRLEGGAGGGIFPE